MGELFAKGQAPVASKRPYLAGRGCDFTDHAGSERNDDKCNHDRRAGEIHSRVVKDLDKWEARRRVEDFLHISHGEAQRDKHDESQHAVHANGTYNGLWQCP